MSTQTFASDSIPTQGFQLGYLHKQAESEYPADTVAITDSENIKRYNPRLGSPTPPDLSVPTGFEMPDINLDPPPLGLALDPTEATDNNDDGGAWSDPTMRLQPEFKKTTPEKGGLQLAQYEADVPEAPAAPDNREAIRKILTSLAPGAAIGGTAGVGLSLAGDARKGEGVNLGKAVGMGVGGATLGALIQGLAQRNKMKAMMA